MHSFNVEDNFWEQMTLITDSPLRDWEYSVENAGTWALHISYNSHTDTIGSIMDRRPRAPLLTYFALADHENMNR